MKQRLTVAQQNDILASLPVNPKIPARVETAKRNAILLRLRTQLARVELYPALFPKFKDEILRHYYESLCPAGDCVGILCAQSLGESSTQSTLNSFHSAGMSIKMVNTGVPRFSELLSATKSPKIINSLIYLNKFNQPDQLDLLRNHVENKFTEITLKKLVKTTKLFKANEAIEPWMGSFLAMDRVCDEPINEPDAEFELRWRLRFFLNLELLYEYKVSMRMIARAIRQEYVDAVVVYSPEWAGMLDVLVDCQQRDSTSVCDDVAVDDDLFEEPRPDEDDAAAAAADEEDPIDDAASDSLTDDEDELEDHKQLLVASAVVSSAADSDRDDMVPSDVGQIEFMEDSVRPALLAVRVCGIKGIREVFFEKRRNEWIITTEGSNLYGLFADPLVDKQKTLSNDMWEIYTVFGIEATRQFLLEEYVDIVSSDGSYIGLCHLELLVDIMCNTGTIISINRYGQKKLDIGPLSASSFEETLENFLKSAVYGDKEDTHSVSASIMLGKMPRVGTGAFEMRIDLDALPSRLPPILERPDETVVIEEKKAEQKKAEQKKVEEKKVEEKRFDRKATQQQSEPIFKTTSVVPQKPATATASAFTADTFFD